MATTLINTLHSTYFASMILRKNLINENIGYIWNHHTKARRLTRSNFFFCRYWYKAHIQITMRLLDWLSNLEDPQSKGQNGTHRTTRQTSHRWRLKQIETLNCVHSTFSRLTLESEWSVNNYLPLFPPTSTCARARN